MGFCATVGIDLSTRPRATGVCVLQWDTSRATIIRLGDRGYDTNDQLLNVMRDPSVTKVAIDAPFGWPDPFVTTIAEYQMTGRWSAGERKHLVLRETDRHVATTTRLNPLSVAADKIAHPAIRCAELLTEISQPHPVDRTGAGLVAEVYPAAALDRWNLLPNTSYRGSKGASTRITLVENLKAQAPWLDLNGWSALLLSSDHLIDALVCAILAKAITRPGLTEPPPALPSVSTEGWIHLPLPDTLGRLP